MRSDCDRIHTSLHCTSIFDATLRSGVATIHARGSCTGPSPESSTEEIATQFVVVMKTSSKTAEFFAYLSW
jgi:hypothetical protein